MKIMPSDYNVPRLTALLSDANEDTDPASVVYFGPNGKADAEFAVIVVKGRDEVRYVSHMLETAKLLTPDKPINPAKQTVGIMYPDSADDEKGAA